MFNTPKKLKQPNSNAITMEASQESNPPVVSQPTLGNTPNKGTSTKHTNTSAALTSKSPVFENGTMFGSISNDSKLSGTSSSALYQTIPEMVISSSCSTHSLNRSRCEMITTMANSEETAVESTSLLDSIHSANTEDYHHNQHHSNSNELQHEEPHMLADEFEQFILNRTTSESNILESSIYSELQFPPSVHGGSTSIMSMSGHGAGYVSGSGGPISVASQVAGPQTPSTAAGQNSRQAKRTKRKHKTKSKCTATAATLAAAAGQRSSPTHHFPPRYTAIFMDPHGHGQYGNVLTTHHSGNAANALGQIASAAASSPFLNGPVATGDSAAAAAAAAAYMQQFQYFQQRPLVTAMGTLGGSHRRHHRSLFEAAAATTTTIGIDNPLNALAAPIASATVPPGSLTAAPMRLSFRKWFSRPSLPFVIGILALGGVACTLGGIVLGSTGLIEHSTQYLSAALLMIGIGVSLLVISGAIWRLSLPDDVDDCPCYRHMEMCRNCNSPYCNSRLMGGSYLYPEFQHRPPPPSYLTSLNECAGMSLLFHPTASAQQAAHYSTIRVNTPPPLYRSTNSLSVNGALTNSGIVPSLPASVHHHGAVGIVADHTAITMSSVMENLQAQTQALTKEFNYYELD